MIPDLGWVWFQVRVLILSNNFKKGLHYPTKCKMLIIIVRRHGRANWHFGILVRPRIQP